jgi:hypothetical protein
VHTQWSRAVLLLILGMALGYFVLPRLKPVELYGVRVHSTSAQQGCFVEWYETKQAFWEKGPGMGHGSAKLQCREGTVLFPNVEAVCICHE